MAPWVHQHFGPEGKVFPCCIAANDLQDNLGDLSNGDTLQQIWNSSATQKLRSNMLSGVKSKICELCYKYEHINKKSSRQEFNEEFGKYIQDVVNTSNEGEVKEFAVRSIDFRFSNICNLTCRMCSPYFSSKWHAEGVKLGIANSQKNEGKSVVYPVEDFDTLWRQVEPMLPALEKIHFAGGEPLMMEEHYRILECLIALGKFDVQISYNTNFSEFRYKKYDVIGFWKKLRNVSVCASLDGMGQRGEFMRKGISWDKIESNRRRMLAEVPHVNFQLTPTVSIMNVLHLPDFFASWVDRKLMTPDQINIYLLFEPYFYNIINLPLYLKREVEKKYAGFFDDYVKKKFPDSVARFVMGQFNTVLNHMNSAETFKEIGQAYSEFSFQSYNQSLDEMRGEKFAQIFPELKDLISEKSSSE